MPKFFLLLALIPSLFPSLTPGQQPVQGKKKIPPALEKLAKSTPAQILKNLDKDKNGFLGKTELPPFLANNFPGLDQNSDGKLDPQEINRMAQLLRQRFARANGTPPPSQNIQTIMKKIMARDKNQDGKISPQEAQGQLSRYFTQIDRNQDGFLDRQELRGMLLRQAGTAGNPPVVDETDFDALDENANGRLTQRELRNSRWREIFDRLDQNRDGQLSRQEFNQYLERNAKANQTKK